MENCPLQNEPGRETCTYRVLRSQEARTAPGALMCSARPAPTQSPASLSYQNEFGTICQRYIAACVVLPATVAVMLAVVSSDTADVAIGKVAVVKPAGTVTEPGTTADGRSLTKLIVVGLEAGRLSVSVPRVGVPPFIARGSNAIAETKRLDAGVGCVGVDGCREQPTIANVNTTQSLIRVMLVFVSVHTYTASTPLLSVHCMHLDTDLSLNCARWILVPVLATAAACSSSSPTAPTTPGATPGLHMIWGALGCSELRPERQINFHAYTVSAGGAYAIVPDEAVSWASSNPGIARLVISNFIHGSFSLASGGTVEIRATYQQMSAALPVTVAGSSNPYLEVTVRDVAQDEGRAVLRNTPSGAGTDVTAAATWTSTNPSVARVDGNLITYGGPGNAEIRASYDGRSGGCGLSVLPPGLRLSGGPAH
jgi:hypothetical protein